MDVEVPPTNKIDFPFSIDLIMDAYSSLNMIFDTHESALAIRTEVKEWFNENQISYKYSVYFGILYFITEENKVKFILKWL